VVIVGGGPAGMEAARVAAERGHHVTLLERSNTLGGAIRLAARAPGWEAYANSVDWLERQLTKLPIEIQMNCEATVGDVRALSPADIVIATGAAPRRPALPGVHLPNVFPVADVFAGTAPIKGRCVILDDTGYTPGPKAADLLSQAGHTVEIVTRQYSLGEDIGTTLRARLIERLLRQGVTITPLTMPIEIGEGAVRVRHMLTDAMSEIPAETVILSSSGVARDELYHALAAEVARPEHAPQLYLIGDAFAPRSLRYAMVDGARVGREI
jgi:NADPH-dependent 2,4-dienoyl-CoA reductase/sulfur reductase-like enzyme